ncbi:MAG: hypothetical protein F6J89_31750, partial [Symploca sp. SIO1C4]|nr:hypothetical protein [Symploca sp. SIO1C4]
MLKVAEPRKVETRRILRSQSVRSSGDKTEALKSYQPRLIKFQPSSSLAAITASQKLKKAQSFALGEVSSFGQLSRPATGWKPLDEVAVYQVNSSRHLASRIERNMDWRSRADINEETFMAIRVQTFQEIKSINFRIPSNDDTVQTLYFNSIDDLVQHYAPGEQNVKAILNAFLKNFKIYSEITSLTAVTIPDFSVVATRAEQQKAALEYE